MKNANTVMLYRGVAPRYDNIIYLNILSLFTYAIFRKRHDTPIDI